MPRLLATQSHVVHGYVGNKAATFPLQCMGWDVDCLNSVQFSNHTGYGMDKVFGTMTDEHQLEQVFQGLLDLPPCLDGYHALLSGYLPNKASVNCVGRYYSRLKQRAAHQAIWLLDPVMGDEGQLYVSDDVIPEYRALVGSGLVDAITPNQFELEILYGDSVPDLPTLKRALQHLHATVPVIVVTSCSSALFGDPSHIYCVASLRDTDPIVYRVPIIDSYFTGVGDLFSAVLLDHLYRMFLSGSTATFTHEINHVLNVVHSVLETTLQLSPKNVKASIGSPTEMREMELRIVQSRDCYEQRQASRDFIYKYL